MSSLSRRLTLAASFALACLLPGVAKADSIQVLTARPELPDGRRPPLCILLPGGPGKMPEAARVMTRVGNRLAERGWLVVVPVSPDGQSFFGDAADHVVAVMDRMKADPEIRPGPVLLAGVSNGGIAALQVASTVPNRVCGVIAVPGVLHRRVNIRRLQKLPVYIRIGADDHLKWAASYQSLVRTLKGVGVRLDARLLQGVGHGVPLDWEEIDAWIAKELGALAPAVKRETTFALPPRAAEFRLWTSRGGASAEASVAEIRDEHVILVRRGGERLMILRARLTRADQDYLTSLTESADRSR